MYAPGPNVECRVLESKLPLPRRVPGKAFSYSDHEGVSAVIRLERPEEKVSAIRFKRMTSLSSRANPDFQRSIQEALKILERALNRANADRSKYLVIAVLIFLLLVVSFIPLALLGVDYHAYVEIALFIPRFIASAFVVIFVLMATVFHKREVNALKASYAALRLINEQDYGNNPVL